MLKTEGVHPARMISSFASACPDFITLGKSLMFIPTSKNRDRDDVDGKLIAPLGFDPHLLRCYQKNDLK